MSSLKAKKRKSQKASRPHGKRNGNAALRSPIIEEVIDTELPLDQDYGHRHKEVYEGPEDHDRRDKDTDF